jgi:DNA-binding IclR family transcriptional regulator
MAPDKVKKTQGKDQKKPRYPIGSVDRVLQLLLLFRDRESIRVADAAAELGVAGSTAHRLLAMLQLHGFVTQDSRNHEYLWGPAIIELSHAVNRNEDLAPILQDATEELVDTVGETTNAAVLRHTSVVFVAGRECDHALRIANQTGRRFPAFHSAPGKVLLASLPPERLRELYPSERIEDQEGGVRIRRRDLEAELETVREKGFATNDVPTSPGSADFESIAVPVRRGGQTVAALSVAAPSQRVDQRWPKATLRAMLKTAAALEAKLG